MLTGRRRFLQQLSAAGVVSLGAPHAPAFLSAACAAVRQQSGQIPPGRILVLVQLAGGNDGLNTVVPHSDPEYRKARPSLAIPRQAALRLNDDLGLHPQMQGFKELYDEGMLAVVQGVGYPNPDRSHFRSTDIWHSARLDLQPTDDGWLGRGLDLTAERHAGKVPALALGVERLPLALVGSKVNVPTVRDLAEYQLQLGAGPEAIRRLRGRLMQQLAEQATLAAEPDLAFLRATAQTSYLSAQRLKEVASSYAPSASYPASRLAGHLKLVAQLMASDLGTRVFFVSQGGYDTHSQQEGAHAGLLSELSAAIRAFFLDVRGHGLADRVLLATYSEFGRRVKENGSLGTDHGAASPMFIVHAAGKGGLHGDHPSLTDLGQGDLKYHTDFRSVYATILNKWLDFPAEDVLGRPFPMLEFL